MFLILDIVVVENILTQPKVRDLLQVIVFRF